jgi:predicted aminopeptidase
VAALALLTGGCAAVGYYAQAIRGGAAVLLARRPIERLVEDPTTAPALVEQLRLVREVREFAFAELAMRRTGGFRHYADLERPYAVWNVVAAPELSIEPRLWCFPVAGCVAYRGYFRRPAAERFAARLERDGLDVAVEGAIAYSTLGWFDDPVLNTFVGRPGAQLVGLLVHELAHQVVYLPGDTVFNESFATAVEAEGVRRWLVADGRVAEVEAYRSLQQREQAFVDLVLEHRQRLAVLYASGAPAEEQRRQKAEIFADLRQGYSALRASWGDWEGYDRWFDQALNNAHLASIGAYHGLVPAFERLLEAKGGDLALFYRAVGELARLPAAERTARLAATEGQPGARSSRRPCPVDAAVC